MLLFRSGRKSLWLLYITHAAGVCSVVLQLPVEEEIDLDDVFLDEDENKKTEL